MSGRHDHAAGSSSVPAASSVRRGRSARCSALETVEGFDARDADVIVGTSAGSVARPRCSGAGVSVQNLLDHQPGRPVGDGPLSGYTYDYDRATGGALPARPRPRHRVAPAADARRARHPRR